MCGRNRKGEGKLNTPLSSSPHPGKMSPPPEGKSLIQRPGELPSAGHASGRPSGLRAAGGGPSAKATEISVFVLFRVFFFLVCLSIPIRYHDSSSIYFKLTGGWEALGQAWKTTRRRAR